jgi:hypothetical protein
MRKVHKAKAKRNDIVIHVGKDWRVLDREYDQHRAQSYYLLRNGKGKNAIRKWVRSDSFAVV